MTLPSHRQGLTGLAVRYLPTIAQVASKPLHIVAFLNFMVYLVCQLTL
jgi:hypothetical protein